jgi:hypothetical protein
MRQQTQQLKKRAIKSPKQTSRSGRNHSARVARTSLKTKLAAARRITEEMFPGNMTIETDYDPEYPSDEFIVFNVQASGATSELLDRQCEWHRRLAAAIPDYADARISISIDPVK